MDRRHNSTVLNASIAVYFECRPSLRIKASNSMYTVEVLGTRKYNSVQGSRPVSGYEGAPPSCVEPHIDFQPFSLFFNLSSPVLFVANLLPFVHKRSLPPLLVNVTGRELVCGAAIIMIMAGRKIEGCPRRPPLMGSKPPPFVRCSRRGGTVLQQQ